jgi:hypothetical protein
MQRDGMSSRARIIRNRAVTGDDEVAFTVSLADCSADQDTCSCTVNMQQNSRVRAFADFVALEIKPELPSRLLGSPIFTLRRLGLSLVA